MLLNLVFFVLEENAQRQTLASTNGWTVRVHPTRTFLIKKRAAPCSARRSGRKQLWMSGLNPRRFDGIDR